MRRGVRLLALLLLTGCGECAPPWQIDADAALRTDARGSAGIVDGAAGDRPATADARFADVAAAQDRGAGDRQGGLDSTGAGDGATVADVSSAADGQPGGDAVSPADAAGGHDVVAGSDASAGVDSGAHRDASAAELNLARDAASAPDMASPPDVASAPDAASAPDSASAPDTAAACTESCRNWTECSDPTTGCDEHLGCCVPCGGRGQPCCVDWNQGLFYCDSPTDVCGSSIGVNDRVTYYCCANSGDGCCWQGGCSGGTCCKCPRNGLNFCVQPSFGCGGCN